MIALLRSIRAAYDEVPTRPLLNTVGTCFLSAAVLGIWFPLWMFPLVTAGAFLLFLPAYIGYKDWSRNA